jgi:magnesium chelatase family protein
VVQARARQTQRQGVPNGAMPAAGMDEACRLEPAAAQFLQGVAGRLGWSGRSLHRVMKLARTIADLADAEDVGMAAVAEAVQYRRALPER